MTLSSEERGGERVPLSGRLARLAGRLEDGAILRVAFFGLLVGTASVLYLDYETLVAATPAPEPARPVPILPAYAPGGAGGAGASPDILSDPALLEAPLEIALGAGGRLHLVGSIEPGSAARFAEEIAARGEYVETIVLESPGGSVADALAIGALVLERGYTTRVENGALCASSCPIIFASGAERVAGEGAAIGVHQVYATALAGGAGLDALTGAGIAMAEAQRTTAEIARHLALTGVDAALWLHALETPPDRLYYFTPEEMTALNLATRLEP